MYSEVHLIDQNIAKPLVFMGTKSIGCLIRMHTDWPIQKSLEQTKNYKAESFIFELVYRLLRLEGLLRMSEIFKAKAVSYTL